MRVLVAGDDEEEAERVAGTLGRLAHDVDLLLDDFARILTFSTFGYDAFVVVWLDAHELMAAFTYVRYAFPWVKRVIITSRADATMNDPQAARLWAPHSFSALSAVLPGPPDQVVG